MAKREHMGSVAALVKKWLLDRLEGNGRDKVAATAVPNACRMISYPRSARDIRSPTYSLPFTCYNREMRTATSKQVSV
jgi:hypothetical protein